MTFIESVQTCLRKYAEFNGRASRSEYWWWALAVVVATLIAQALGDLVGTLVALATLLPCIAVATRRLHDSGRSGWWQLIGLLPVLGWLVLIYFCVQPTSGPNEYGDGPSPALT